MFFCWIAWEGFCCRPCAAVFSALCLAVCVQGRDNAAIQLSKLHSLLMSRVLTFIGDIHAVFHEGFELGLPLCCNPSYFHHLLLSGLLFPFLHPNSFCNIADENFNPQFS